MSVSVIPKITKSSYRYGDAFHALCPYFAMFPPEFAREAIKKYSKPNDLVLDPFSGRGTTLLEARLLGRNAIANDINPVAVAITQAKTKALNTDKCIGYIDNLERKFSRVDKKILRKEASALPKFFQHAYHKETLLQVLWLREKLSRVSSKEGLFVKTLCLGYLHGEFQKTNQIYFSNNLPHTYCPKPDYSVRFWEDRGMKAPKVDVFLVLRNRTYFRLSNSVQHTLKISGHCILGDVRQLDKNVKKITKQKVQLVVTSPPYLKITSYEEDQWLRLWFLGYPPAPSQGKITKDDRIASQEKYIDFLSASWRSIAKVMKKNGTIVCRIGQSANDHYPLRDIIKTSIKKSGRKLKLVKESYSPFKKVRQAQMFGGEYLDSGEYDFVIKAL